MISRTRQAVVASVASVSLLLGACAGRVEFEQSGSSIAGVAAGGAYHLCTDSMGLVGPGLVVHTVARWPGSVREFSYVLILPGDGLRPRDLRDFAARSRLESSGAAIVAHNELDLEPFEFATDYRVELAGAPGDPSPPRESLRISLGARSLEVDLDRGRLLLVEEGEQGYGLRQVEGRLPAPGDGPLDAAQVVELLGELIEG
jgi:hypothetical protein